MKKFYVDYEEVSEKVFEGLLYDAVVEEVSENYDDLIDETEEEIKIFGMSYNPSYVLKNIDPVAYRCSLNDFIDSQLGDYNYELERYDEVKVNGITFEIIEEDEE